MSDDPFEGLIDGVVISPDDPSEEVDTEAPPTRTRKPRSDKGQTRGGTGARRRTSTSKLADELLDPWAKLARGLAFTSPTMSAVMLDRGEATTKALVSIAEKHPKMLAALRRTSQVGPATDIAETVLMMVIALNVDLGRMPADHPIAMVTGVAHFHGMVHPEDAPPEGQQFSPPPAPPKFTNDPTHKMYSFSAGKGANSL